MKKYTSMFYWENNDHINSLHEYRKSFHEYVDAYKEDDLQHQSELRAKLIVNAPKAEAGLLGANVPHWMDYGSRAGGYRQMSITHELPELVRNQFSTLGAEDDTLSKIDDMYLRAIGIYEDNKRRAFFNTFNPFLYINALVKLLLLPIFTILDVKPSKQERGLWWILQLILRIPAYYITVIHPLINLLGYSETENEIFSKILANF